jgi:hypothetical protein
VSNPTQSEGGSGMNRQDEPRRQSGTEERTGTSGSGLSGQDDTGSGRE